MTEFKPGDHVHVEFDARVERPSIDGSMFIVQAVDAKVGSGVKMVNTEWCTKIQSPLPSGLGAVIRCDGIRWLYDGFLWRTQFGESRIKYDFRDLNFEVLSEGIDIP